MHKANIFEINNWKCYKMQTYDKKMFKDVPIDINFF